MGRNILAEKLTRIEPPSTGANNQDVFLWALYLLGGSDRDVDVEDIYLKSFELAPKRYSWRTRPDLPDYKKTAKALQEIEAKSHVGLIHHVGQYDRRLTAAGSQWIELYIPIFETIYGKPESVKAANSNEFVRKAKRILEHDQFRKWKLGQPLDRFQLADLFECTGASPEPIWIKRIDEYRRVSQVTSNPQINDFLNQVSENILGRGSRNG